MLNDANAKAGKLELKADELFSLAVAVTRQCDGCITVHTDAVIKTARRERQSCELLVLSLRLMLGRRGVFGEGYGCLRFENKNYETYHLI